MYQTLVVSSALLWVLVLLNLLLTLALIRQKGSRRKEPEALKPGQEAPPFIAQTLNGDSLNLKDYLGRPSTFVFISPDCEPCRESLPRFEGVRPRAEQSGISFVLVSTGTTSQTEALVKEFQLQSSILIAPEDGNPFTKDYKVTETPFYCVLDENGKVLSTGPALEWGEWRVLSDSWGGGVRNVPTATFVTGEGG